MSINSVIELLEKVGDELLISNCSEEAYRLKALKDKLSIKLDVVVDEKTIKELIYVVENCEATRGFLDIGGGKYDMATWANLLASLADDIINTFCIKLHGRAKRENRRKKYTTKGS